MKKFILTLAAVFATQFAMASPIDVSLVPSNSQVTVGESFQINVNVSGLGIGEDLAGYQFDLLFDNTLASLDTLTYGTNLGLTMMNPFNDPLTSYLVEETSLEFDLNSQADSFTLISFEFIALSSGAIAFGLDNALFSDSFALPITFNDIQGITVNAVPVSSSLSLLALGLVLLQRRSGRK